MKTAIIFFNGVEVARFTFVKIGFLKLQFLDEENNVIAFFPDGYGCVIENYIQ